jgi:hypothetical protein
LPENPVNFTHLERMTDDTGLLEHALGDIPRRGEGYTTDDNARALWTVAGWHDYLNRQKSVSADTLNRLMSLADRYLAFLIWAQEPDGHFYNNYSYDRHKEKEEPSDDCLGRTLWSCVEAYLLLPGADRKYALSVILEKGFGAAAMLKHPRGFAYTLAAASELLNESDSDETFVSRLKPKLVGLIHQFEAKLIDAYQQNADEDWHWFEPAITYSNGIIPWSLLKSWKVTRNEQARTTAQQSLDFLIGKMTTDEGHLRPVGNKGWCTRQQSAQWDQQPVEIMALSLMADEAAKSLAIPDRYFDVIRKGHAWFHGANDLHTPACTAEGGGYDGLRRVGLNRNQGAESTLSYLLTEFYYAKNSNTIKKITKQTV